MGKSVDWILRATVAVSLSFAVLADGTAFSADALTQSVSRPGLTARVGRFQGEPAKKRKGPKGFDLQFRLVGARFDGTFVIEGVPQTVPEGEGFDAQIKLTNLGGKKNITVDSVTVTGQGLTLNTDLLVKKVDPRTSVTVAAFKVPPQSSVGASFLVTVVLSNGDKHRATLEFKPTSS